MLEILKDPLDFLKWLKAKSQKKITQKTQNQIDKICKNAPKKWANRKRLIIPFDIGKYAEPINLNVISK